MNVPKPMIKRAVMGLLALSALIVCFFSGSAALFERDRLPLPFGFRYCFPQEEGRPCGKIQDVNPEAVRKLLASRLHDGPLVLDTRVYSPAKRSVKAALSGNGDWELIVNGVSFGPAPRPMFTLKLDRGYNDITLSFRPPAGESPRLSFSLSEEVPFYRLILPGRSLSGSLSRVLAALDRWKMSIFIGTFLFLLFRTGMALFPIEPRPAVPGAGGPFHGLLRAGAFFLVFGPLAYYLDHALGLGIPDLFLFLGGIAGSLGLFLRSVLRRPWAIRRDARALIVLALIAVFVFLQILLVSGSFLPSPNPRSDLPSHMRMIRHYQATGDILRAENFDIYPQGFHMFFADTAGRLGLPLQGALIAYLVVVSILAYFAVYLLSRELFGPIPCAYFFLALSLTHFRFIYNRFFLAYQFPSMLAVLFFLLALYFVLKGDRALSSVSLAGAVVTYPYYAPFFLWVILFPVLEWLKEPLRTAWQKARRTLLYFAVPLFAAFVYVRIYLTRGFSQHRQGFKAWFKIDPFISMQIINALLLLGGLYLLLKSGRDRRGLRIALGVMTGYLAYYIPYYFFSWGSTYYFMKSMQYVILLAIPLEMIALAGVFRKLENEAWAEYAILSGAAGIYILRILGSIRP